MPAVWAEDAPGPEQDRSAGGEVKRACRNCEWWVRGVFLSRVESTRTLQNMPLPSGTCRATVPAFGTPETNEDYWCKGFREAGKAEQRAREENWERRLDAGVKGVLG